MIIAIRRYLKGPSFKVLLWITLFSIVVFWGGPSLLRRGQQRSSGTGPAVATVNDIEINQSEFLRITNIQEDYLHRIRSQYGQYADLVMQAMGMNPDPKALALETLIRDTLIDQAAMAMNIRISPAYMDSKLEKPEEISGQLAQILPPTIFEQGGNINPAALNRYMVQQKMTQDSLNQLIQGALERNMALELVDIASYVPSFATKEEFAKESVKKKFSIMAIPFDPVLKKEQVRVVSDDELKKYFDAQNRSSKRYWTVERRKGTTWTIDSSKFGVQVTDQEIDEYYQNYKAQKYVATPGKIQVRTILFKTSDQETFESAKAIQQELVSKPDTFAQKAKEISQDEQTAKNGGLIDFFAKGEQDKALEKAAFLLKNDNDISEPVYTKRGIEIVQRVARKLPEYKPLEAVKQEIVQHLSSTKFKEQFADSMHTIIENNNQEEFNKFVTTYNATKADISVVEGDAAKASKVLFALHEVGAMNYFFENGKAVIVKLDEITKRAVPPLESVKDRVLADLHNDLAKKTFEKMVKDIAAQALAKPMNELAQQIGATVTTTEFIKKDDTKALEPLKKLNVAQVLFNLEKVGNIVHKIDPTQAVIVRLDALDQFDEKLFQEKKASLTRTLERQESSQLMEGFVASLYRNAKIVTSESMVNTTQEDDYSSTDDYL